MKRREFLRGSLFLSAAGLGWSKTLPPPTDESFDGIDEPPAPAPKYATVLFDGKDLSAWTGDRGAAPGWKVQDGYVEVVPRTGNLVSKEVFRDFQLHVEFRVPLMEDKKGQARGNSGVYLQGKYEVQILDSYGLEPKNNDCGSLYTVAAPLRNACKKPEVWQAYDIAFRAPRYDETGKPADQGRLTVFQNRILIHNNLAFEHMTGRASRNPANDPREPGPVILQNHSGNPVRFRNLWIVTT